MSYRYFRKVPGLVDRWGLEVVEDDQNLTSFTTYMNQAIDSRQPFMLITIRSWGAMNDMHHECLVEYHTNDPEDRGHTDYYANSEDTHWTVTYPTLSKAIDRYKGCCFGAYGQPVVVKVSTPGEGTLELRRE